MLFPSLSRAGPPGMNASFPAQSTDFEFEDLVGPQRSLPNIDLGIKCSYQERQWRIREKKLHKKALRYIKSPLAMDIIDHQSSIRRTQGLMAHGQRNKKAAAELQNEKVRIENNLMADRLLKVQNAVTEITRTNVNPNQSRTMVAIRERKRALRSARVLSQTNLDRENAIFLSRLVKTKSALNKKKWENDYKRHLHIQKNMCRLAVPSYAYGPKGRRRKRNKLRRRRKEAATAESSILDSWFEDMSPSITNSMYSEIGDSGALKSRDLRTASTSASISSAPFEPGAGVPQVDRGQIFQEWVKLDCAQDGERSSVDTFLVGFNVPEANAMTFEATGAGFTRYVDVPLDALRRAIDSYNGEKRISYIASSMLSLVGPNKDLVWAQF